MHGMNKKTTKTEEDYRLLDTAAKIWLANIHFQIGDFEQYPASDKMFDNIDDTISPKLLYLLKK